ncbi:unnamed protein product [Protopolystoma xenopodis]|uniref:Uncharacterized protein n=1 Tax=Protopolystoma xenopodis TaxID=117903 RepID=A0A3S5CNL9_9PLAT|nr:unnamed protein product [Protopolystoma xenopodis]
MKSFQQSWNRSPPSTSWLFEVWFGEAFWVPAAKPSCRCRPGNQNTIVRTSQIVEISTFAVKQGLPILAHRSKNLHPHVRTVRVGHMLRTGLRPKRGDSQAPTT